jgi:hypothetical protein
MTRHAFLFRAQTRRKYRLSNTTIPGKSNIAGSAGGRVGMAEGRRAWHGVASRLALAHCRAPLRINASCNSVENYQARRR